MIVEERIAIPAGALAEAKAYLRIETTGEDAGIAGLLAAACGVCEAFVGQMLVARGVGESVAASGAWTRLGRTPVRAVMSVAMSQGGAVGVALAPAAYAVDIDGNGDGWVRYGSGGGVGGGAGSVFAAPAGGARLQVEYRAGIATDWAGVPEPLRQGVLRLTAYLYAQRGEAGAPGQGDPPAAVAALWRPYRRMLFGRCRQVQVR